MRTSQVAPTILFIGRFTPHRGGVGIVNGEVLRGLARLGHRVVALATATPGHADANIDWGIEVAWFDVPRERLDALQPTTDAQWRREFEQISDAIFAQLPDLFRASRPDLVLVGHEPFVWGVPAFAQERNVSCAVMAHGPIRRLLEGRFPEPLATDYLDQLRRADLILCCAENLARVVRSGGFDRVTAVPNGVDTTRFRPRGRDPELLRALGIDPGATVALHLSNLVPVKRPLDLVVSATLALARCPNLVYLVVGDGPCRGELEHAARERGVRERFHLVGRVPHEQVPQHLALADMVLMPSLSENLPLAYLEAMACGRVLIASDIPAAREVVREDESGLLFRMGDADDLATKTLVAARDPALRARIGAAARRSVLRHHRAEDMVARHAAALQELVERHGGSALGAESRSSRTVQG